MKKILLIMLFISSMQLFCQEKGVGLNIQITMEKDVLDNGTSTTETRDNVFELGGSYHHFKDQIREYEGLVLIGYRSESNGVSEENQLFFGLGGGINLHLLVKERISAGFGGRLSYTGYLEPQRDPSFDYDSYFAGNLALELPLFLDVTIHEKFLMRFSAVAAGLLMDFEYQEYSGLKEKSFDLNLFTAVNGEDRGNWLPLSIYIIYKI